MMEFVKTKRGAQALLHEGYKYVINQWGRDDWIFWRCAKSRTCSGSLCTMDDQIVLRKDIHNHPPDEAETEVEKIVGSLKEKVQTTAQPIPAVYNEGIQAIACRSDRDEIVTKLPTFSSLKTSLYRQHRSRLLSLPKTRANVHFDGKKLVNTIATYLWVSMWDKVLCISSHEIDFYFLLSPRVH